MRVLIAIGVLELLTACSQESVLSGEEQPQNIWDQTLVTRTVKGTASDAWDVAQTPFEDVGLKQEAIPPLLEQVVKNPYLMPFPLSCQQINNEINALNKVLGPEECTFENPTGSREKSYTQHGADFAQDQALGIVRSRTSILPFRSIVRRVSGAEQHSRALQKAYEAGKLRRAYLRGLAFSYGCPCWVKRPASAN